MELTTKQKAAFGIGAVGKDMVYALSASYVMYYYQDILGLPATFVGLVLMIARVFDAFNDPFMGVLVTKTRTRWGRFRPWIFTGTVLNAAVLYALFAAPVLAEAGMMVYFSVIYILWGVTYTMMDIPYWSMIPAVTRTPADRENLSVVGRTCAGVGAALFAIIKGTDYMTLRIANWKNPWDDAQNKGLQAVQSMLAIGSGGVFGLGLGNGRQKFLYLPEPQNDFIFAVVCEELGLVGACLVLLLFALLIIRGYWLALNARDRFGSLVIVGITTLFAFQVFANVAVVTNLFPVTGISLPFFSYGGSALIIQLAEMGLILSISRQNPAS